MSKLKRVLIIAYYWPPAGGGGVQRWLKFTKYLPQTGWQPIIYTPENPNYPDTDETLVEEVAPHVEVIKRPIWEPYTVYQRLIGKKKSDKVDPGFFEEASRQSFMKRFSIWVRGNLFIPDARRFWIRPSVRFLEAYLRQHPVDVILSTGTPHSMHLIARELKKRTGLPWVADFRDPWTKIEFYHKLQLGRRADSLHHQLEKAVMQEADHLITVSWNWAEDFRKIGAKAVTVITNGYDPEDFRHKPPPLSREFTISHIGTFAGDRNPVILWECLQELADEDPAFGEALQIRLTGKTDPGIFRSLAAHHLKTRTVHSPYVPHADAIQEMQSAQLLLLLINQVDDNAPGRIAGKIFEYIAANRPVLCLGPENGDAARVLAETNAGRVFSWNAKAELKAQIRKWFDAFQSGNLQAESDGMTQFSRPVLTEKLGAVLDGVS
jgi:glycosyltransferase involved in cell wall biosynthesis